MSFLFLDKSALTDIAKSSRIIKSKDENMLNAPDNEKGKISTTVNNVSHLAVVNSCWVDVRKSLPELVHKPYTDYEYSENVLAWCNGKLMVLCLCFGATDSLDKGYEYGYWWANCDYNISCDDAEWDDDYKPTHWMPLPTEPSGC